MQRHNLWAPWRMQYIQQLDKPSAKPDDAPPPCFLCQAAKSEEGSEEARQRLVIARHEHGVILLNRYPYTSGHLLIAADVHAGELSDLTPLQRHGLMDLVSLGSQMLQLAFNPQGLNVGINIGRCAGAGFPGHLHIHIVPRWSGDTNFMEIVGGVKVIPQALEATYESLRTAWLKIKTTEK